MKTFSKKFHVYLIILILMIVSVAICTFIIEARIQSDKTKLGIQIEVSMETNELSGIKTSEYSFIDNKLYFFLGKPLKTKAKQ